MKSIRFLRDVAGTHVNQERVRQIIRDSKTARLIRELEELGHHDIATQLRWKHEEDSRRNNSALTILASSDGGV